MRLGPSKNFTRGGQFCDYSDGRLLLLSVTVASCIGTLILYITYPSPQLFNELNVRDKCAKGKVHVSGYDANVICSTPYPPSYARSDNR